MSFQLLKNIHTMNNKMLLWVSVLANILFFITVAVVDTIGAGYASVFAYNSMTSSDIVAMLLFSIASVIVTFGSYFLVVKDFRSWKVFLSITSCVLSVFLWFELDKMYDVNDNNTGMFGNLGDVIIAGSFLYFFTAFFIAYVIIKLLKEYPAFQKKFLVTEIVLVSCGMFFIVFTYINSSRVSYVDFSNESCLDAASDAKKQKCLIEKARVFTENLGYPNEATYETNKTAIEFCQGIDVQLKKLPASYPDLTKNLQNPNSRLFENLGIMTGCFKQAAGFDHCDVIPSQPFRDICYLQLFDMTNYCAKIENPLIQNRCKKCAFEKDTLCSL